LIFLVLMLVHSFFFAVVLISFISPATLSDERSSAAIGNIHVS